MRALELHVCLRPIADISVAASLFRVGHVFISYAREDREVVSMLRGALEQKGFNVWVDDRLTAGAHYDDAIEQALEEADNVIVAWSTAASASQWVRAEAGEGLQRGILVPVLIEPTKVPLEFRRIQTVDLTTWAGDSTSADLEQLLLALRGCSDGRPAHQKSVAEKRQTAAATHVSAELLSANKLFFNFRVKLRVGDDLFIIRHVYRMSLYQAVKVNGQEVARSPRGTLQDHFRFLLEGNEKTYTADLFVKGEIGSGISGIVLEIDRNEVLRENVTWADGLVTFLVYIFMMAFTTATVLVFAPEDFYASMAIEFAALTVVTLLYMKALE